MGLLCASVARYHKTREKNGLDHSPEQQQQGGLLVVCIYSLCFYDDGTFSTRHIFHENDITLSQPPHTLLDHHLKWDLMKVCLCKKGHLNDMHQHTRLGKSWANIHPTKKMARQVQ